jgi:hypothetical protein
MFGYSVLRRGMSRAWSAAAMVVLILVGIATLAAPASAGPGYPPSRGCTISIGDLTVTSGGHVTVIGSGFRPAQRVVLTIHSPQPTYLDTVTTDASGAFRAAEQVPSTLSPGAHHFVAESPSATCSLDPTIGQVTPPTPTVHASGGLAFTGFAAVGTAVVGALLLAGGVLFVLVGRRRRA